MIFSRDAVQAKLNSLANSSTERSQTLLLISWGNLGLAVTFLLSTLFTSGTWGSAVSFQATSTAGLCLAVAYAAQEWLKRPDLQKLDLLGGAYLVTLLLLLQTTLLWGNLSSGFLNPNNPMPCFVNGSGGDKAVSILSGVLFITNAGFAFTAYRWKADWLQGSGQYVNLTGAAVSGMSLPASSGTMNEMKTSTKTGHTFDDDVEGGL